MVTLYHWELPQKLQELGGWTNSEIVGYMKDYAELIFEEYGDRVKVQWTNLLLDLTKKKFDSNNFASIYSYGQQ